MSLDTLEQDAWHQLGRAAGDPQSGFRYVTLCSIDLIQRPQARTVVLREVNPKERLLDFHTDIRSAKWEELAANPHASVLGYCPHTRCQLRLTGEVTLFGSDQELTSTAWESLPSWTRTTYQGGPPGDEAALGTSEGPEPDTRDESDGKQVFGVIRFKATCLDWFQLQRQNNRRALFDYNKAGDLIKSCWVNP